jgi:hypothetical protein
MRCKIPVAVERLREIGIDLDSTTKHIGGVRFDELRITLHQLGHYLNNGSLNLAKQAADEHNASPNAVKPPAQERG